MVEVSLLKLVQVVGSQDVWPADFVALNAKCEADVADRVPFGVAADWCDEHDEPELADAFRWLHRRPDVRIRLVKPPRTDLVYFSMENPPVTMTCPDGVTVAALCAQCELLSKRAERDR